MQDLKLNELPPIPDKLYFSIKKDLTGTGNLDIEELVTIFRKRLKDGMEEMV